MLLRNSLFCLHIPIHFSLTHLFTCLFKNDFLSIIWSSRHIITNGKYESEPVIDQIVIWDGGKKTVKEIVEGKGNKQMPKIWGRNMTTQLGMPKNAVLLEQNEWKSI